MFLHAAGDEEMGDGRRVAGLVTERVLDCNETGARIMAERVVVTVGTDGEIRVEADGSVGRGCEALTAAFEEGLGTKMGDQKKPEWYRTANQPNTQAAGGGRP